MTSYRIDVPEEALERLRAKLDLATFPDELQAADQWPYGAPLKEVRELAEYWKSGFDWRKAEATLNELPQFMTTITPDGFDPIDVHFIHHQSPNPNAIPLLFVHGWPGSYIEVTKLLKPLSNAGPGQPAFHIVAPSLPNFGFSGVVTKPGFNLVHYAETCQKLMLQLGYTEFVTQGGDWGFYITRALGLLYPENVKASHVNMIRAFPPEWKKNPWQKLQHTVKPYTQRDKDGFKRSNWFGKEGSGYNLEQRTKPQTIGFALADSPVALLAWIYEKLHDWTDNYPWTPDEILTWVSIYQFSTAGPAASVRIYYESVHSPHPRLKSREDLSNWIPDVKLGLAHFPKELTVVPQTWGRTLGPVVHESINDHGGHFAAWEHPEVIVGNLRAMFNRNGPCYRLIRGKSGYEHREARL